MKQDQIKIKFIKRKNFIYPKPYIFKITPKDLKEFSDKLKPGQKGLMKNTVKQKRENLISKFIIVELGHFDNELHKPLMITKMFNSK